MINSIYFKSNAINNYIEVKLNKSSGSYLIQLIEKKYSDKAEEISLIIEFSRSIIAYRSPRYTWEKLTKKEVSLNSHSPKVIVFDDGTHMISSSNIGAWVLKNTRTLEWVLKSSLLTPIFHYAQDGSRVFNRLFDIESFDLELLCTKGEVPEFSRSKIPFKAIICFTDHCDFDHRDNLSKQLLFFNQNNIKVSKGIFLNHFSKRPENTSYERDSDLIKGFHENHHELFYHALTQSARDKEDAIREFQNFVPPVEFKISTYVDHGYQIYNLTKRNETGLSDYEWSALMAQKGIHNFWNYLDSGTANSGIINQLNTEHFSLGRILKYKLFDIVFIIRTQLFFSGNEGLLLNYRELAKLTKKFIQKKSLAKLFVLTRKIIGIAGFLTKSLLFEKNKVFKYATHTPFIFKNIIGGNCFNFFQTVEVTNFEKTFSRKNIDLLIKESGAIIAHCYFSSPLMHQTGRLFAGDNISFKNQCNFEYLKHKIQSNDVWNPAISELIQFTNKTSDLKFYWDETKQRICPSDLDVPIRYIRYV
jgi:hypothetical protein